MGQGFGQRAPGERGARDRSAWGVVSVWPGRVMVKETKMDSPGMAPKMIQDSRAEECVLILIWVAAGIQIEEERTGWL